ncbi:HEAT repeat domain-containing protein [Alicyclobacillus herbarius]|uniref:HEAT repeat domain-containing protein n=1 Tax=Alicyclobacillus herbarius TaxID=122960 RepID=UPI0012DE5476|nr:hypothetical protein [Alicyclobacillus herbarius]
MIEHLKHYHPLVRIFAFYVAGSTGDINDIGVLLDYIRDELNTREQLQWVVQTLSGLRMKDSLQAQKTIETLFKKERDPFVRRCLVELVGYLRFVEMTHFLYDALADRSEFVRIGVMHSFYRLQTPSVIPVCRRIVEDGTETDPIIILAMKILAYFPEDIFRDLYVKCLGHRLWWVRYYSALALARVGNGQTLIMYYASHHEDRFARDMARYFSQLNQEELNYALSRFD